MVRYLMVCLHSSRSDGRFANQRQEGHGALCEFRQHEGAGVGLCPYYERGGYRFALVNSLGTRQSRCVAKSHSLTRLLSSA